MRAAVSTLIACGLFTATWGAQAGWYVVSNYEGHIGPYPVHFSLQKYSIDQDKNLLGSYFYDKYRAPIPLYGRLSETSLEICEIHTPQDYDKYIVQGVKSGIDMTHCPFKLTDMGEELRGEWSNGKTRYDVSLRRVASFDDSEQPAKVEGQVDIPFWGQTATHSFVGVYQNSDTGMVVEGVKAINKKSGNVDQLLQPDFQQCQFGFFMTPVYMNIENGGDNRSILLNCYSHGGGDILLEYRFDAASQRYGVIGE
ncbi:hypothetical protein [Pectobacterium polaris]|uniref:hypothetical protein n=1 Tax=Pectobacterium polaris TaxID=2042057 RepID=UPI000A45CC13|nr:hypothetical protein [Pectobacterium polaris]ASY77928.1 hypothetical protein BJJ97_19390 [Pectobacterium polaris]